MSHEPMVRRAFLEKVGLAALGTGVVLRAGDSHAGQAVPNSADLHERLRQRATRNRRSLSQETLACLEQATAGERVDADELLARAWRLRAGVKRVSQRDLRSWVTQGRS